jgi:hypothetical protein
VKADRNTFGPRLRLERERRGIALKNIAASTKIKESLFVELERNDFSNWPQGIFRRAHLGAYLSAIGLPPQPILAEYLRLFPEDHPVDHSDNIDVNQATDGHRAEQTPKPARLRSRLEDRTWVVCFDLAAVCLSSSILAWIVGMNLWPAIAVVGLAYSAIGSACFAQGVGTYIQQQIKDVVRSRSRPQPTVKTPVCEVQFVTSNRTRSTFSQGDTNQEPPIKGRRASA